MPKSGSSFPFSDVGALPSPFERPPPGKNPPSLLKIRSVAASMIFAGTPEVASALKQVERGLKEVQEKHKITPIMLEGLCFKYVPSVMTLPPVVPNPSAIFGGRSLSPWGALSEMLHELKGLGVRWRTAMQWWDKLRQGDTVDDIARDTRWSARTVQRAVDALRPYLEEGV